MPVTAVDLVLQAGLFVKVILLILLSCSVFSWAIMIYKQASLSAASKQSREFLSSFGSGSDRRRLLELAQSLKASPLANVFSAVARDGVGHREEVKRLLRRYEALESERVHSYLTFLATTGSTAPFIGLLGTVWGIMNAFRGIGQAGSASLAVVAPGIAEALITTAVGLATAIPSVLGYNYYLSRARKLTVEMEDFSEELLDYFSSERVGAR